MFTSSVYGLYVSTDVKENALAYRLRGLLHMIHPKPAGFA